MSAKKRAASEHHAGALGITGAGDETERFQQALDRLAEEAPAVLVLDRGRQYTVHGLVARNGVTLRGERSVLQDPDHTRKDEVPLLTVGRGVDCALEGIHLRAAWPLKACENGIVRFEHAALAPAPLGHAQFDAQLLVCDEAQLLACESRMDGIGRPSHPVLVRDRARFEWIGGELVVGALHVYDSAAVEIDVDVFDNGRLDPGGPGLVAGRRREALWQALRGTQDAFKHVLGNPAHAADLEAWRAHNRTQDGRVDLRARRARTGLHAVQHGVAVGGGFTLEARDSVLQRVRGYDEARVHVRASELERVEAYGLSHSRYEDVDLIARGREDPWHPVTTYLQGYHVMEYSRQYNDIVPLVEFTGGRIVFAGDDCLNALPEGRALQLMEVAHDQGSVFADFANLERFAPEAYAPGEPVGEARGGVGAVHDEARDPCVPFDFRRIPFVWRGAYDASAPYVPGDLVAHRDLVYVCNAPARGVVPNRWFECWQIFNVAFRNEAGYLQVARRVRDGDAWRWQKRQALGPWHGFVKRERGNPIVTYQVHLKLENTSITRHANTWSWAKGFAGGGRVPVGDAAYEYLLSCLVANVWYNTENNRVECKNVELVNVGTDAMLARGLCLGPNRHTEMHSRFAHMRIRGEGLGVPICLRVDKAPLREDNTVLLTDIACEATARKRDDLHEAVPGDPFVQYEFLGAQPPDWQGIDEYLARFVDSDSDEVFRRAR